MPSARRTVERAAVAAHQIGAAEGLGAPALCLLELGLDVIGVLGEPGEPPAEAHIGGGQRIGAFF